MVPTLGEGLSDRMGDGGAGMQGTLTCGAVRSGELASAEGARAGALAGLWVCGRPKGCRRGLGLRLPSESLLWLLGGVGGKCRWSTEAEGKRTDCIHQGATEQDLRQFNIQHPYSSTQDSRTKE